MSTPVLVTGGTGTVGAPLVAELQRAGMPVRVANRAGTAPTDTEGVRFDFLDATTWPAAFAGVERMFLLRPPRLGNVRRDVVPALEAARRGGVRHVVLLSVQGADRVPVLPHAVLERWLAASGFGWTFVRPSFFAQNLTGPLAAGIRRYDAIVAPAGRGRTAFVDARDVAAVAAAALIDPAAHIGTAWTPTGPEALTYHVVAERLSAALGRRIRYVPVGLPRYLGHAVRGMEMQPAFAAVTGLVFSTARLGLAAGLTGDVRRVLGRDPLYLDASLVAARATLSPA